MAEPFKNVLAEIQKYICEDDEVIDFGCGLMPVTRNLKCKRIVGIDAWFPYIEQLEKIMCDERYNHIALWYCNIEKTMLDFIKNRTFDIVLAIDVIEHFEKEVALKIIEQLERIARKKVILFTPIGFKKQEKDENSEFQRHRCGFAPDEIEAMGYDIYFRSGAGGHVKSFLAIKNMEEEKIERR